jgi:hypothetical protein
MSALCSYIQHLASTYLALNKLGYRISKTSTILHREEG